MVQAGQLAQDTFTVELRPFEGVDVQVPHGKGRQSRLRVDRVLECGLRLSRRTRRRAGQYAESYGKGEGREAKGVFIAPTSWSIHGWFWENPVPSGSRSR